MPTKTFPGTIKAKGTEDGLQEGQFRALVSVFNNRDAMGDVVVPGAFLGTLKEWKESGDSIPVYWSHQMHDPDFNIGWVESAEETPDGLEVLVSLDMEPEASPKARTTYRLLKKRRVTQFSFAYDVIDAGAVQKDGQTVTELRELKLYEVGPTPIGANTSTELLEVKHYAKTGRALSAKNEAALADAVEAITAGVKAITTVLASVQDSNGETAAVDGSKAPDQEQAPGTGPATTKEPPLAATVQEPRRTPASTLAAHLTFLELEGDD